MLSGIDRTPPPGDELNIGASPVMDTDDEMMRLMQEASESIGETHQHGAVVLQAKQDQSEFEGLAEEEKDLAKAKEESAEGKDESAKGKEEVVEEEKNFAVVKEESSEVKEESATERDDSAEIKEEQKVETVVSKGIEDVSAETAKVEHSE